MTDYITSLAELKTIDELEIQINIALVEGRYEEALSFENELKALYSIIDERR